MKPAAAFISALLKKSLGAVPHAWLACSLLAALPGAALAAGSGDDPFQPYQHDDKQGPGPGGGGFQGDSLRMKDQAYRTYGQLANRLNFMAGRLEAGKNPRAFQVADQIREILAQAKGLIDAGRPMDAFPLFGQAEGLFSELSRLSFEVVYPDPDRPATSQNALMEAAALQQRLQDHLFRLRDRPGGMDDKTRGLQSKVQELLDKCKENLAAGKPDAAKELALKAEALLAELHLAAAGGIMSGSDPGRRRIEDRLQRASDLALRRQAEGAAAERLALVTGLLEQARGALQAGKTDAAEAALRHAEKILSESAVQGGGRLSASAFDRMQGKLDRATALVKASGSEKAARILEKAVDHFGKAERFRSEGQKPRAEAELDIALKLAAKAVDIARAAGR